MYKILKDSIKELSIAIIVVGLARQLIYYANFKLPIKYFLGLSELWLIISDDIFIMSPLILIVFIGVNFMKDEKGLNRNSTKFANVEKFFLSIFILGMLFLFGMIMFSGKFSMKLKFGAIFIFMLSCAPALLDRSSNNNISRQYFPYWGILAIILLIFFKTGQDIDNTEHGKYLGTTIVTDKKNYVSNDTTFFIGKTDKYIFFHNKKTNSNTIIPTDLIIEMEIKTNYGR